MAVPLLTLMRTLFPPRLYTGTMWPVCLSWGYIKYRTGWLKQQTLISRRDQGASVVGFWGGSLLTCRQYLFFLLTWWKCWNGLSSLCNHHKKGWFRKKLWWIPNPKGNFNEEQDSCTVLKCLSTNYLLVAREKIATIPWKKTEQHFYHMVKTDNSDEGQMGITCLQMWLSEKCAVSCI